MGGEWLPVLIEASYFPLLRPHVSRVVLLDFGLQLPLPLLGPPQLCIIICALSPDWEAFFFWLRRAFRSLVIQDLLFGKQRTVLPGRRVRSQNVMYFVMQSVMLLTSSHVDDRAPQSVHSKQSCRGSWASYVQFLTVLLDVGCRWTRGTYFAISRTRL